VVWWSPLDAENAIDTSDEEQNAASGVKALLKACGYEQKSKPRTKPTTSSKGVKATGNLTSYYGEFLKCYFESWVYQSYSTM